MKNWLKIGLAALTALVLTACGGSTATSGASSDLSITLEVLNPDTNKLTRVPTTSSFVSQSPVFCVTPSVAAAALKYQIGNGAEQSLITDTAVCKGKYRISPDPDFSAIDSTTLKITLADTKGATITSSYSLVVVKNDSFTASIGYSSGSVTGTIDIPVRVSGNKNIDIDSVKLIADTGYTVTNPTASEPIISGDRFSRTYTFKLDTTQLSDNTGHTITAKAVNKIGMIAKPVDNLTTMPSIVITPSNNSVPKPTVEISNAADLTSGTQSGSIPIRVSASDSIGIKYVQLLINGTPDANFIKTTSPYTFTLDTAAGYQNNGEIKIAARAVGTSSGTSGERSIDSAPITISTNNPVLPTITITKPVGGTSPSADSPITVAIVKPSTNEFTFSDKIITVKITDAQGKLMYTENITDVVDKISEEYSTESEIPWSTYPTNPYTVTATTKVKVGEVEKSITNSVQVTPKVVNSKPPSASILFPVAARNLDGTVKQRPILNRNNSIVVKMTDDGGLTSLQIRLYKSDGASKIYIANADLGNGKDMQKLYTLGLDGSEYVADGNYELNITVFDSDNNTNVQTLPITIQRDNASIPTNTIYGVKPLDPLLATLPTKSIKQAELNYEYAIWTLVKDASNTNADLSKGYSIVQEYSVDGVSSYAIDPDVKKLSYSVKKSFGAVGNYAMRFFVQDLESGATGVYTGENIAILKNP